MNHLSIFALNIIWIIGMLKWVEFIGSFPYIIKHKKGKDNMIADALSRWYTLLSELDCQIFGLESVKEQYALDPNFKDMLLNCRGGCTWNKFMINDGFLFRANRLCIPVGSVRLLVPFVFCYCRRHMEADWWDILVPRRRRRCCPHTSFGLGWAWCGAVCGSVHHMSKS